MTKTEKKKIRKKMEAMAKQHDEILSEELVNSIFWFMEEGERCGNRVEIIGAISGDGFFEFVLQTHKVN